MADHAAGASGTGTSSDAADAHGGTQGDIGTVDASQQADQTMDAFGDKIGRTQVAHGRFDRRSLGKGKGDGLFGGLADMITDNPIASILGIVGLATANPAFGLMGLMSRVGKAYGDPDSVGPVGPGPDGDAAGPPSLNEIQQAAGPKFNPVEDLVGSEYVAYNGIKADEIQGLVGQYAGVGKGTGLMTGPFGMSNTQV